MLKTVRFGDKPQKIIFFPCGNIDIRCYIPLFKIISDEFTVIAVDFIKSDTKTIKETKEEVEKLIKYMNEDIFIVAHSFGADIVKNIETKNIKVKILLNSCIFNPLYTPVTVIIKTLIKSIIAPIKYSKLFIFYLKANLYLAVNLITHPIKTLRHIRQCIQNITSDLSVTEYFPDQFVIASKDDEYFPISLANKFVLSNIKAVQGNQDWLMNNIQITKKMIIDLIRS